MGSLFHSWNLTPKQGILLQKKLAPLVETQDRFTALHTIAGADLAFTPDKEEAIAGIVLFEYPSLKEIERVWAKAPVKFPYVPGLLSFREGSALIRAFKKLKQRPDLMIFDGQGLAHPRRMGIASHLGLYLDIPSIGCAKSRLCGTYAEPGAKRGSRRTLIHQGEKIGVILRTRDEVKPIFVSVGHRVSLATATKIIMKCHDGTRIPKPTREADHFVAELKRQVSV